MDKVNSKLDLIDEHILKEDFKTAVSISSLY